MVSAAIQASPKVVTDTNIIGMNVVYWWHLAIVGEEWLTYIYINGKTKRDWNVSMWFEA